MGKLKDRRGSLALVRQPTLEKENSQFKPTLLRLKIDLVLHPAHGRRVGGNTYKWDS